MPRFVVKELFYSQVYCDAGDKQSGSIRLIILWMSVINPWFVVLLDGVIIHCHAQNINGNADSELCLVNHVIVCLSKFFIEMVKKPEFIIFVCEA